MIQEIIQEIVSADTIIIHRHVRPDPDAYGSQCGLAEIIRASFPEKKVYRVGLEEKSLHFLTRLDEIPDSTYEDALVIVCDTANAERICDDRYKLGKKLIKIDHHPNDDKYGDLIWVDTEASSTSEMIYDLFLAGEHQGLKMTKDAARLIYAGIIGDTGRFLFKSTSVKTFKYAAELISFGFDFPKLYNELYEVKIHIAKLNGYVLEHFQIHEHGVATMKLTKEVLAQFNATPADASQLVGSLGNIEGILTWVFFIEEEDQIRVRLRSKGPIVNDIAKRYNGGGHPLASGASIYNWNDAELVRKDLIERAKSYSI